MSKSPFILSKLRLGLGTFVAVDAEADSFKISELGTAAAYDAIALVEHLMHPSRPGSDLAAMRDCALGVPLPLHAWTWTVLAVCLQLHRLSLGTFDPCLPGSAGSLASLELQGPRSVVQHDRLRIDLGGIAKGFAVDRAIDALRAAGCRGGLVNAGGDLAVFGDRDHDIRWRDGRECSVIQLRNAALASSAVDAESRPAEHRGYYNGADGRAIVSGRVAITAPRAVIADGLTKCLLAGGSANGAILDAFDARLIGFG